jgi:hypothetical protein
MIALMKIRKEKKAERERERELMNKNPSTLEEEKQDHKQEKQEWREHRRFKKDQKKCEKEQRKFEKKIEKKDKSKSPKKEKSADKKRTTQEVLTDGLLKGVTTVTQTVQEVVIAAKDAISKKKYAPGVLAKANQIKEVFPDADMDALCEFVKQHFKLSIDQLIDEFLQTYKN